MRRNKQIEFAVDFLHFIQHTGLHVADAADIIQLAARSFRAGERNANEGSEASQRADERAGERLERKAESVGFKAVWPGLWPRLERGVDTFHIPAL